MENEIINIVSTGILCFGLGGLAQWFYNRTKIKVLEEGIKDLSKTINKYKAGNSGSTDTNAEPIKKRVR